MEEVKVSLEHTRDKYWKTGYFYLLPTIRYSWDNSLLKLGGSKYHVISIIWFLIRIELSWYTDRK